RRATESGACRFRRMSQQSERTGILDEVFALPNFQGSKSAVCLTGCVSNRLRLDHEFLGVVSCLALAWRRTMTMAILGSAVFFVAVPSVVAGLIPWWVSGLGFLSAFLHVYEHT